MVAQQVKGCVNQRILVHRRVGKRNGDIGREAVPLERDSIGRQSHPGRKKQGHAIRQRYGLRIAGAAVGTSCQRRSPLPAALSAATPISLSATAYTACTADHHPSLTTRIPTFEILRPADDMGLWSSYPHTCDILCEVGCDDAEIETTVAAKVLREEIAES